MSSKVYLEPVCVRCGASLGMMSDEEFFVLEEQSFDNALCFDCEPVAASHRPEFFKGLHAGEIVDIGDSRMCVTHDGNQLVEVGFVPAHERSHERNLSSYTKLNRISKKPELTGQGIEISDCPNCKGQGFWDDGFLVQKCDLCAGNGLVESAIVIPAWIISAGCENV